MKKKTDSSSTRHGKRADGKTSTSISISEDLLRTAREAAAADGRSLSNWIEQHLKDALKVAGKLPPLGLALCALMAAFSWLLMA